MPALVNIATQGQAPVYILPSSVSALYCNAYGTARIFTADGTVSPINLKVNRDQLTLPVDQGGLGMLAFNTRGEDGGMNTTFVSPHAITFATVSEIEDNTQGMILGVNGYGRIDMIVLPGQWQTVLLAMQAQNRTLLHFGPDQAHTRFHKPQALYIYPQSIIQMMGDGCAEQLNVYFSNGDSLDIQVTRPGQPLLNDAQAVQEMLTKRTALANLLSKGNAALVRVDGVAGQLPVYLCKDVLRTSTLLVNEDSSGKRAAPFYIRALKPEVRRLPYESQSVFFNTAAARDAAFADLQRQLAEQPSPQKLSSKQTPGLQ